MKKLILTLIFCLVWSVASAGMMDQLAAVAKKRVAASGPSLVAYDNFTDTDSTALASHTSDSGHSWTQNSGGTLQILNNRAESNQSTSAGLYYSSYTPASADYSVKLTIKGFGSARPPMVAGRCTTSTVTMYGVRWDGIDTWYLIRFNSGSRTDLDTYTGANPETTAVEVELLMTGAVVAVKFDGTQQISLTDGSPITSAGRPGVGTYYCDVASGNSYADSWEVWE